MKAYIRSLFSNKYAIWSGPILKNILIPLTALLIATVCFQFYAFVFRNAVNVPFFDDLAYLKYVMDLIDAPGFVELVGKFLDKHNGHGVLTAKLVFWIDYLLEGHIDYRHLIIVGSMSQMVIFLYFVWIFRINRHFLLFSLPVALFVFTPACYEDILWAAASWQYMASFVMGILMYVFLAKAGRICFVTAVVLGFITTYTNGNGLICFFLGFFIPLLQKQYLRTAIWLAAVIVTGVIFYWYYPFSLGSESGHYIGNFIKTLIGFLGAAGWYFQKTQTYIILLGTILAVSFFTFAFFLMLVFLQQLGVRSVPGGVLDFFGKERRNLSLFGLMLWLLGTALGTAWTRGGENFFAAPRYLIYSVMSIIVLYVMLILLLPGAYKKMICLLGILAGLVFQIDSYLYIIPDVVGFRNSLWADVYNLQTHTHVNGKVESFNNPIIVAYFKESLARGIYKFPKVPIPATREDLLKIENPVVNTTDKFVIHRDTLHVYSGVLRTFISNDRIRLNEANHLNCIYIALKDTARNTIHLVAVKPAPNYNRKRLLTKLNHFEQGFTAVVYAENVPAGWYKIGVLSVLNSVPDLYFTDKIVEIRKIDKIEKFR